MLYGCALPKTLHLTLTLQYNWKVNICINKLCWQLIFFVFNITIMGPSADDSDYASEPTSVSYLNEFACLCSCWILPRYMNLLAIRATNRDEDGGSVQLDMIAALVAGGGGGRVAAAKSI